MKIFFLWITVIAICSCSEKDKKLNLYIKSDVNNIIDYDTLINQFKNKKAVLFVEFVLNDKILKNDYLKPNTKYELRLKLKLNKNSIYKSIKPKFEIYPATKNIKIKKIGDNLFSFCITEKNRNEFIYNIHLKSENILFRTYLLNSKNQIKTKIVDEVLILQKKETGWIDENINKNKPNFKSYPDHATSKQNR
jgi:hypothetical protein